ncbi:MAG: helix-turn-helix transcriptional regulator [Saprospiraceae bacterium]
METYSLDSTKGNPGLFAIKRMEQLYEDAQGKADHPHRHAYYTVIWAIEGSGSHRIDFKTYPLSGNAVFFVSPGQVHQLIATSRPKGYVITFSKEFLQQNHISEDFINEINLFNNFENRPPIFLDSKTANLLQQLVDNMAEVAHAVPQHQIAAQSAYLKLFFIYCEASCNKSELETETPSRGKYILREFKKLIEAEFKTLHKVSDYADRMHLTPRYLNQVVKSILGHTAKELIQEKLILNAKRELWYSEKSVKEIAIELGFDDPLYFSSFFKNCTGLAPSEFRESGR